MCQTQCGIRFHLNLPLDTQCKAGVPYNHVHLAEYILAVSTLLELFPDDQDYIVQIDLL